MNSWAFTGNLGNDAEHRNTPNGDTVVTFSVGVKSGFGDRATTTWARCAMFGKRGESVAPYLVKGQLVGVTGELSAREWYDDKSGQKRTSIEVRVSDLTLLGKRDGSQQSESQSPRQQAAPQKPAAPQNSGGFGDFDDSIPF